jgi:Helix-turn-helix domain
LRKSNEADSLSVAVGGKIRAVPQIQLPIFPAASTAITRELAFEQRDGQVYYFNGYLPVFCHGVDDIASFRFFTSQLIANGSASQGQISRAFGVPLITVKRMCKKLREHGATAFYQPPMPVKGHKLTPDLIAEAQTLLDEGLPVPAIGKKLGVLPNTIHKAISYGRLKKR